MTDVKRQIKKTLVTNKHAKMLVKCVTKTAEKSVKEAAARKQDQHILLKVQLPSTLLVFSS